MPHLQPVLLRQARVGTQSAVIRDRVGSMSHPHNAGVLVADHSLPWRIKLNLREVPPLTNDRSRTRFVLRTFPKIRRRQTSKNSSNRLDAYLVCTWRKIRRRCNREVLLLLVSYIVRMLQGLWTNCRVMVTII